MSETKHIVVTAKAHQRSRLLLCKAIHMQTAQKVVCLNVTCVINATKRIEVLTRNQEALGNPKVLEDKSKK